MLVPDLPMTSLQVVYGRSVTAANAAAYLLVFHCKVCELGALVMVRQLCDVRLALLDLVLLT